MSASTSTPAPWYLLVTIPELNEPIPQYQFRNRELENLIYSSAVHEHSFTSSTEQRDAFEALTWAGNSVLDALTTVLLVSLFPTSKKNTLNNLRQALESKAFYAHLSRRVGLNKHITITYPATESDGILSGLFTAYVGAIQRELGADSFTTLGNTFFPILKPYAEEYKTHHDKYSPSPHQPPPPHPLPSTTPHTPLIYPIIVPQNESSAAKIRRQNVSVYTSRLMEYAAKCRLPPPSFFFKDNGCQGAAIQWCATVNLNGCDIASAVATTKLEAKHLASKDALQAIGSNTHHQPISERRQRKFAVRRAMGIPH